MRLRRTVWLILLVGFAFAWSSPSALAAADSTKLPQDSNVTPAKFDMTQFPSSYDPKVLETIGKLSLKEFAFPIVTVVPAESTTTVKGFEKAAFVWMQVRFGADHLTHEAKVLYCSAPGHGFEQAAFEESDRRQFSSFTDDKAVGWFWYQVLFTGTCGKTCSDTLELPSPSDFVPCDIQPKMIEQGQPQYPALCKRMGQTGLVWVKELIERNGFVISAMVGKSSGVELLDQAAIAAAYLNRFKPAYLKGRPVAIWVTYKVVFKMNE